MSFTTRPPDSTCQESSADLIWQNPPASPKAFVGHGHAYDSLIADPALSSGVYVSGSLGFVIEQEGSFLVEVFLIAMEEGKDSFSLEVAGSLADTRYRLEAGLRKRLRPKRTIQHLTLLGGVEGGQAFRVLSEASPYVLSAVRWTPLDDFERDLVPEFLQRVRTLFENPFDGTGHGYPFARRNSLEQLCSRLLFSGNETIRREAAVGLVRALYWLVVENHESHDLQRLRAAIDLARQLVTDDDILQQTVSSYCLGLNSGGSRPADEDHCKDVAPVSWRISDPPDPGAPAWAVSQEKLARRMDAITRWWVENRQHENGELGGGWGDDVEILRSWGPQALGFGSEIAARGIRTLTHGLWESGLLLNGYDRRISDVEHSSEPTTDTQPLYAALEPDNREVLRRLAETASCAHNWIRQQPDGRWRFQGSWFNCREFDPSPERALDVHLNTRAMGPALWYAYLTRNPEYIQLVANWAESWVEAMRSSQHGKPPGFFPPVLRSRDGTYLIRSDRWDRPQAEWDYYQWSGNSQDALTSLLLAVFDLTGEDRWLDAAGESFAPLEQCHRYPRLCHEIVAASRSFFEWRRLSGDRRYDSLFSHADTRDLAALRQTMTRLARENESRLSVNLRMFTSEAIFTDRVDYRLPPEYGRYLFGGEPPRGERYPAFAVTWPASPVEFSRAVVEASDDRLQLLAYSFEPQDMQISLRVWRLRPGPYQWTMKNLEGDLMGSGEVVVSSRPEILRLPLLSRTEVVIEFLQAGS